MVVNRSYPTFMHIEYHKQMFLELFPICRIKNELSSDAWILMHHSISFIDIRNIWQFIAVDEKSKFVQHMPDSLPAQELMKFELTISYFCKTFLFDLDMSPTPIDCQAIYMEKCIITVVERSVVDSVNLTCFDSFNLLLSILDHLIPCKSVYMQDWEKKGRAFS